MLGEIKVLLADEHQKDFEYAKKLLKSIKNIRYELEWTKDFERASNLFEQQNHDVYLIDIDFESKDGRNLLDSLEANKRITKPVIILTDENLAQKDLDSIAKGACEFLVKRSVDAYKLQKAIQYAMGRHKAVNAIFRKEEQDQAFFEHSMDCLFRLNTNFEITEVNREWRLLFKLQDKDSEQDCLSELFLDNLKFQEFKAILLQDGKVKSFGAKLQSIDDKPIICVINCSALLDVDGNVFSYQGVIRDITEEIKIDKENRLNEKYIMTGRLSRMIAHEVRNPLTNISLASSQIAAAELPQLNTYVEIINRNCKRINELITHIMQSSTPTEVDKQKCEINQILKNAVNEIKDRAELKNVAINTNFYEKVPILTADAARLKIAVLNLLVNAIEAINHNNGEVSIASEFVEMENDIKVTITDNGSGMDEKTLNSLFEPFFTSKKSGNGLGLSSVRNIIKAHNGGIEVLSTQGKGSCFIISLPV
jgi:signal transduction histidine kinase/CheY-like chemotaxis protein